MVVYTAVYTGRVRGRVHIYTTVRPPCTRAVYAAMYAAQYTAVYTVVYTGLVHGGLRAVYTAVARSCAGREYGRLHDPYTAVYGRVRAVYMCALPCTLPSMYCCTRPVHTAVYYTARVHDRVHGPHTAVRRLCACREHGCVYVHVYMAVSCVHGRATNTKTRPCTRRVHGHSSVRDVNTVVYTPCIDGRIRVLYGRVQAVYRDGCVLHRPCPRSCTPPCALRTAVYTRPCTQPLHGRVRSMYAKQQLKNLATD